MAKKLKYNFNVDKLKICFRQNEETFKFFADCKAPQYINRTDYTLHLLNVDDDHAEVNVIIGDEVLGMFVFNNSKKYEGLCFFRFENKALYSFLTRDICTNTKCNLIPLIEFIADDLQLEFNNITELEVAYDINFNVSAKLRKLIKDFNNYDMFVNGKKIKDPNRVLDNYHETFKRNRRRLIYPPTLYFEQKKIDAPLLRIYNKSEEIKDNEFAKEYITEWNDFGNSDTYRIEIRLKSNSIKEFLKQFPPDTHPLQLAINPYLLASLWCFFTDRMVYFRHTDGTEITLADLTDL